MVTDNIAESIRVYGLSFLENIEVKAILSAIAVCITTYTGVDIAIYVSLLTVIILDWVFGIWKAKRQRKLSKDKFKRGIGKLFFIAFCIFLMVQADFALTHGKYHLLTELTISSIIITEIISILDHCIELKLPLPAVVYKIAEQAQTKINGKIETIGKKD